MIVGFSLLQDTFYKLVIDDAMKNLREVFLNEGIDEQVIQEFKEVRTYIPT